MVRKALVVSVHNPAKIPVSQELALSSIIHFTPSAV
jgi:hypothetical protein